MQTEEVIHNLVYEMQVVKLSKTPLRVFSRWLLFSLLYTLFLVLFLGIRSDFSAKLTYPAFFAEILSLLLIIATVCYAVSFLAFPDIYQKKMVILFPASAFFSFILIMALAFLQDTPPAPKPLHALECLECIFFSSFIPAAFLLFSIRKFATTHYYKAGTLAALAAFAIGALALRIAEPTDSISHVLTWHYLPMFAAALLGALAGRLFLRW